MKTNINLFLLGVITFFSLSSMGTNCPPGTHEVDTTNISFDESTKLVCESEAAELIGVYIEMCKNSGESAVVAGYNECLVCNPRVRPGGLIVWNSSCQVKCCLLD